MSRAAFTALSRLELADALRSKWAAFAGGVYALLTLAFVWFGLHESSVLGFTGLSRVLLNVTSAVVVVAPLIVLIGTHAAVVKARTSGFCELMLTQPVSRSTWFAALLVSRMVVLLGPFILLLLGCVVAALSLGDTGELWLVASKSLAVCGTLVFSFVGIGLLISASVHTTERAMVWALFAFVLTAALHDVLLISVLLRTSLPPYLVFALSAMNPSEAARIGVLSSIDAELSVLGPVGFWLANTLGAPKMLALALAWPTLLGALCSLFALRRTTRMDLVG